MNADRLIDFVLGQLEGTDREQIEHAVGTEPDVAHKVERLGRTIHLLLDDGEAFEPTPGLARSTLALVAQSRLKPRSILDYVPARVPFQWADFAVAASIFIAGVLTLMPAVQGSRERMRQAGCVYNLQQLGHSLAQYVSLNPFYPYPPSHQADAHAGTFAAVLHDAGVLPDLSILDCPYNGPCPDRAKDLPSFDQLGQIRRSDPVGYRHLMSWDYAYNGGYLHAYGRPGPVESRPAMAIPVVADQPPHENYVRILEGNSPNHARRGQNVLYSDGSVRWHGDRRIGPHDLDLFLNNRRELQPGVDEQDSVLLPSYSSFFPLGTRN
jgi:hypothetical protein